MEKIALEGVLEWEVSEGGAAMIAEIGGGSDDPDAVFVRLHSYDERVWERKDLTSKEERAATGHAQANSLKGRRVRITIEALE